MISTAAAELGLFNHCIISLVGNYYTELLLKMKNCIVLSRRFLVSSTSLYFS